MNKIVLTFEDVNHDSLTATVRIWADHSDLISLLVTRRGPMGIGSVPELNDLFISERFPERREIRVVRTVWKLFTFGNDYFFATAKILIKPKFFVRVAILRHSLPFRASGVRVNDHLAHGETRPESELVYGRPSTSCKATPMFECSPDVPDLPYMYVGFDDSTCRRGLCFRTDVPSPVPRRHFADPSRCSTFVSPA